MEFHHLNIERALEIILQLYLDKVEKEHKVYKKIN